MSPLLPALLMIALPALASPSCMVDSGECRVPLMELYTSVGCGSCPPADRRVSELPARGRGPDTAVVLGSHIGYWNQPGWTDPFAQRRFSERQRAVNVRNLACPFASAADHRFDFAHGFELACGWKLSNLSVAAFVQHPPEETCCRQCLFRSKLNFITSIISDSYKTYLINNWRSAQAY
jgi:hypothetical protein